MAKSVCTERKRPVCRTTNKWGGKYSFSLSLSLSLTHTHRHRHRHTHTRTIMKRWESHSFTCLDTCLDVSVFIRLHPSSSVFIRLHPSTHTPVRMQCVSWYNPPVTCLVSLESHAWHDMPERIHTHTRIHTHVHKHIHTHTHTHTHTTLGTRACTHMRAHTCTHAHTHTHTHTGMRAHTHPICGALEGL